MAFDAHVNLAYSTVATAPSPATSGLSLVVQAGEGARFPAVPFNAIICPANTPALWTNAEIVRVTGISTDTFTIERTSESTSGARTVLVGDQIFAGITAKWFSDIEGSPAFTGTVSGLTFVASTTGASVGYLVGAAAGNWGARFSRSAGGSVLLGVPGTTSSDHFTIVTSAGTSLLDVDGTGSVNAVATGASTGFLVGAAAGNWGARFSRSAGGGVLIGTPGTTSAEHLTIVNSAGSDLLDVAGNGAIKFATYTAATFVAGDKYLVIDASGNVHVSALGPAS